MRRLSKQHTLTHIRHYGRLSRRSQQVGCDRVVIQRRLIAGSKEDLRKLGARESVSRPYLDALVSLSTILICHFRNSQTSQTLDNASPTSNNFIPLFSLE